MTDIYDIVWEKTESAHDKDGCRIFLSLMFTK